MRGKRIPFFSFYGRVGRLEFAVSQMVILILMALAGLALPLGLDSDEDRLTLLKSVHLPEPWSWIVLGLLIPLVVIISVASLSFEVRRFHDFGLTGWAILLYAALRFIPFPATPTWAPDISELIFDGILIAIPGALGRNTYGPDPRNPNEDEIAEVFAGPLEAAPRAAGELGVHPAMTRRILTPARRPGWRQLPASRRDLPG